MRGNIGLGLISLGIALAVYSIASCAARDKEAYYKYRTTIELKANQE